MQCSEEGFLPSHAGALHKPHEGAPVSPDRSVSDIVGWQLDAGIDVPNDGEVSKPNFFAHYEQVLPNRPHEFLQRTACVSPVTYIGHEALQADIATLRAAMDEHGVDEAFFNALSPSFIETVSVNRHYASTEEYIGAVGEALRVEYEAVAEAGLILQIDAPELALNYDWADMESVEAARSWIAARIEILNHALRNVPTEQTRIHVCWGSWSAPHVTDLPLRDWVDLLLTVDAQCYSLEAATVAHEMDHVVWDDVDLPDGELLMPGMVTHKTFVCETPELVAHRFEEYARRVGRENVIGGTDCGLSRIHDPTISRAKLEALAGGARLASARLWSRAVR